MDQLPSLISQLLYYVSDIVRFAMYLPFLNSNKRMHDFSMERLFRRNVFPMYNEDDSRNSFL